MVLSNRLCALVSFFSEAVIRSTPMLRYRFSSQFSFLSGNGGSFDCAEIADAVSSRRVMARIALMGLRV